MLAIVVTSAVALVLGLSGSFIYLVKITLISRLVSYAITCVALTMLRRRKHLPEATFKVPAGNVVACGCAMLCVLFLVTSSMRELLDVAIAALVGLAICGFTRFSHRNGAREQIGAMNDR